MKRTPSKGQPRIKMNNFGDSSKVLEELWLSCSFECPSTKRPFGTQFIALSQNYSNTVVEALSDA